MKLSHSEIKMLDKFLFLEKRGKSVQDVEISRRSEKEYDITVRGRYTETSSFSAWLPLGMISVGMDWTKVAHMTDYPEMVCAGDWSGVRDSSEEAIWAIFKKNFC